MEQIDRRRVSDSLERLVGQSGEEDIRSELRHLLRESGAGDYRLNVRVGSGFADMVCPEFRVLIETKSRGDAEPSLLRSSSGENQFAQVERYVKELTLGRLDLDRARPWRGFLTDGRLWWGWEWSEPAGRLAQIPRVVGSEPGTSPERFETFVRTHLAPAGRYGMQAPPEPLKPLFEPFLTEVKGCLESLEMMPFFATKLTLWRQVLKGSGLLAEGHIAQTRHFAEHTLLVVAARMIVAAAQGDASADRLLDAVGDGFCAWLTDFEAGADIARRMAGELVRFDWGAADRDLLKGLYHDLIDPEYRKEFGEFYTPDWLARDLVNLVLTPDVLDAAIDDAATALGLGGDGAPAAPADLRPFQILDPACGSGTFLFWSARAVAERIRTSRPLLTPHTYELAASIVVGMDIHPIAAEMARATLATALAAYRPSDGPVSTELRVFLADSLYLANEEQQNIAGTLPLRSAKDKPIDIPAAMLEAPDADAIIANLVETAIKGRLDEPAAALALDGLDNAAQQMAEVIGEEGNHVWGWYLRNQIAPAALHRRRAAAILTNPPWLVANDTPDGSRKADIQRLRSRYDLRGTARYSAQGDLAAIFTARVADLYLRSDDGVFGFVLPGSALINQTWRIWRSGAWGPANAVLTGARGMDDVDPPPFPHSPNGACLIFGRRSPEERRALDDGSVLVCSGDPVSGTVTTRTRRTSRASIYEARFRRGVLGSPLGLLLVVGDAGDIFDGEGMARVVTKVSTKGQWRGVQLEGRVESGVLVPVLRAQRIESFRGAADAWYIAPGAALGRGPRSLVSSADEDFRARFPAAAGLWAEAEQIYVSRRNQKSRPTLWENLDYNGTLSQQLGQADGAHRKVFYNKSGGATPSSRLRACRGPTNLLADDKCYWFVADSTGEALYLTGVLNADCMQDAWRESKTSRNHFDKNPLRHVPIPPFDEADADHAMLTDRAALVEDDARNGHRADPQAWDALDEAVRRLLPDYAT